MAFAVSLVSPERVVWEGEAVLVIARGTEGEFGIQTGHAPFLAALDVGELFIRDVDNVETRAAVHQGFLDMRDNVCTVLADVAELGADIDVARAEQAAETARRRLAESPNDNDAKAALKRAETRQAVAR